MQSPSLSRALGAVVFEQQLGDGLRGDAGLELQHSGGGSGDGQAPYGDAGVLPGPGRGPHGVGLAGAGRTHDDADRLAAPTHPAHRRGLVLAQTAIHDGRLGGRGIGQRPTRVPTGHDDVEDVLLSGQGGKRRVAGSPVGLVDRATVPTTQRPGGLGAGGNQAHHLGMAQHLLGHLLHPAPSRFGISETGRGPAGHL